MISGFELLETPTCVLSCTFWQSKGRQVNRKADSAKELAKHLLRPHAINEKLTTTQPEPLSLCCWPPSARYWSPSAHKVLLSVVAFCCSTFCSGEIYQVEGQDWMEKSVHNCPVHSPLLKWILLGVERLKFQRNMSYLYTLKQESDFRLAHV